MEKLLLALLLMVSIQPCLAESASTRFDKHLKTLGLPIDGVSGSGPGARIDCSSCTKDQRNQAVAEAESFDWIDKPDPQPEAFLNNLAADENVDAETFLAAFRLAKAKTSEKMQAVYTKQAQALSQDQKDKLESAAAAANMEIK